MLTCGWTVNRTWTAIDACGNKATCIQKISCICPPCETACAAQAYLNPGQKSGDNAFPGADNWFTYIKYKMSDGTKTYPIYSGQNHLVGTLTVSNDGTRITVKYALDGKCGGYFSEYHLQVEKSLTALQSAICNKKGSAVPGQCEYKGSPNAGSVTVKPTETFSGYTGDIYIFAHSVACTWCNQ